MSDMPQKKSFSKRRKTCPFTGKDAPKIDWKDVNLLSRYISERGKIIPSRITAVSAPKQRELALAIKRARNMGLIAPVRTEQEARPPRPDRPDRGEYRGGGDRPDRGSFRDRDARPSTPTTPQSDA